MMNWQNFSLQTVKDAISKRKTKKLLERAELEESLKRENFLTTSVNLQKSQSSQSKKFEQSWPSPNLAKKYVPSRNHIVLQSDNEEAFGASSFEQYNKDGEDNHDTICTVFWKLSLTLNQYKSGEGIVDFGSLWPDQEDIQIILLEAYQNTPIRRCIKELTQMVLRCGPLRVLKVLLDLNLIGLDQHLDNGNGLLHTACIARNFDAAVYLCSVGVDPKQKNHHGKTAIDVCFCPRIRQVLPESVFYPRPRYSPTLHDTEVIFEMASNVREVDNLLYKLQTFDMSLNSSENLYGDCILHVAARSGLAQLPLLLCLQHSYHADVDLHNRNGITCLMIAAQGGHAVMVDALLCILGADPDLCNPDNGWSALHYACAHRNTEVVSVLLKRGANFNQEDHSGCRPDDLASRNLASDCQELISMHRQERIHRLTMAVTQGYLQKNDVYLSDLYLPNDNGNTLIMEAAANNKVHIVLMLLTKSPQTPIDAQHPKTLQTALSLAARAGHKHVIRVLIKYGSSPCIRDIEGFLPLHHAVRNNHQHAVEAFLNHKQALTGLYKALHLAHCKPIQHLLKAAVNRRQREIVLPVLFESAMTGDAARLYCMLEEGDNVNPTSGVGEWPLYMAVENGHLDTVKLLCQNGGDLSRFHPSTGNTVLHVACARGHYDVAHYLIAYYNGLRFHSLTESLLNLENKEGKVPLILAAERGYSRLVKLLLHHGASSSILDPATGDLYQCTEYQGCQVLIETHRKQHLNRLVNAMAEMWGLGLQKFKTTFRPKYDHNLRDREGNTLLMNACKQQKVAFLQHILSSAVYPVGQTRRDYIRRCESADSGTVFDLTPENSSSTVPDSQKAELSPAAQQHQPVTFAIGEEDEQVESAHEATETESAIQSKESKSVASPHPAPSCSEPPSLPAIQDPEVTLTQNMSALFDSISCMDRGQIYISETTVSHLCAASPRDGRTCFHRAVEGGDNIAILSTLIQADSSGINIQDDQGLSPLHLACSLKRRKIVKLLVELPSVDLNCRTLDGKLPEEMCRDKTIMSLIQQARADGDQDRLYASSAVTSAFPGDHPDDGSATSVDFEKINTRFVMMKQQMGVTEFYGEFGT